MGWVFASGFTITAVSLVTSGMFNGVAAVGVALMTVAGVALIRREGRAWTHNL